MFGLSLLAGQAAGQGICVLGLSAELGSGL